jgi:hypothetical protein
MSDQVLVIVADEDNPNYADITILSNRLKAAGLVEALLEEGFEQSRIRVFEGRETVMQVRHRPVVSFVSDDEDSQPADGKNGAAKSSSRKEAKSTGQNGHHEVESLESLGQNGDAEPYKQDGVRFSEAFRQA